jgi:hypothetical protein
VERGNRNVTFGVLCTICDGLTCDIAAAAREHVWRFAKQSDDGGTVSVLVSGMCSLPAAASTSLQS